MKWASWTDFVLGLWLIVAPFALGYASVGRGRGEDVLFGIVIAGVALWRSLVSNDSAMAGVSWIVALAGLWVLFAPFALGYSSVGAAMTNDVIVGAVVFVLSVWQSLSHPHQPHHAQQAHPSITS
jgi:hypothetical protein